MRDSDRYRARLVLVATVAGFLLAGSLHAHDTWILPNRPGVNPGRQARKLWMFSGIARVGEAVTDLGREVGGKKALRLKARFPQPGIAAVWIESKARALELKPAEVKEYLEEIGAWDSVGRKWESEGKGRWRESYTKHAKTYVRVGRPDRDDSWARPVGMELELVPESDPTHLATGEELQVRLLKNAFRCRSRWGCSPRTQSPERCPEPTRRGASASGSITAAGGSSGPRCSSLPPNRISTGSRVSPL